MKKKKIKIASVSSLEVSLAQKERFNPYMIGYGEHKSAKYPNRATSKRELNSYKQQY